MREAGLPEAAVGAFERAYDFLKGGGDASIAESAIEPSQDITHYGQLEEPDAGRRAELLGKTVVIKLNGGLGTGMGLEKAKSLLEVRDGLTFLDLIAKQVLSMRESYGDGLRFLLMNSFSTSADTLGFLEKYPQLGGAGDLELLQNRAPKIDAGSLGAVAHAENPDLEWCPPGHGDLYPALVGSGWLDRLLDAGVIYAFVSNSDNLGATLDPRLLSYFAESDAPFLMEVTARTEADKKGGHLARAKAGGGLLLRESAQCPAADVDAFQDIGRHRYFNTNNLWIRLDALKAKLDECGGVLPLPVIVNNKTVDPRDDTSTPVVQLETAMGAAIECFEGAGAVEVLRSRFAPVKTSDDLLALRSDAYVITDDFRLELAAERGGKPPVIALDKAHYKRADQLDAALQDGVPSLLSCDRLEVSGPVAFEDGTVISGAVRVENASGQPAPLPAGSYADQTVTL